MPELRLDREELERLEAKLSRMIQDDRIDEASLARQIDRVETARATGNKTRSVMLTRMYRVLTKDQRLRFDQLSKQWAAARADAGLRPCSRHRPSRRRPRATVRPTRSGVRSNRSTISED